MRIIFALVLVCIVSIFSWASLDYPLTAPDWQDDLRGVAYNPSSVYTDSQRREGYPESVVREDLEQLGKVADRVRTYAVDPGLDLVPSLANKNGLKVSLGLWLSDVVELNEKQIKRGIEVIKQNPDVIDRVFVGNEAVLRGELTALEVGEYIMRVKKAIPKNIPVGTADVWSVWLKYPELAEYSDFIGIHLLPYWEGIKAQDSMAYIENRFAMVKKSFPKKPVVIAEAGWPSEGRVKKGSVPSPAMQAYFLRHFLTLAEAESYDYYIIEAFDQPWKAEQEGAVGAFWGLFDAEGQPKFGFTGQLSSFNQWKDYAVVAVFLTLLLSSIVFALLPLVSVRGYILVGVVINLTTSGGLFIIEASSLRYADWGTFGAAMLIAPAGLFAATLMITEAIEWALSLWRKKRVSLQTTGLSDLPLVSIHVPTHNEPPLMVMQTLNALSRLNYPNFEVIVLDNNTRDESFWRPIEAHCQSLGSHFRFFHFDNMSGFKAGALNKALALTDSKAKYIAVIDSDYQVASNWLSTVMPAFAKENVALVQAPQDYRDRGDSWFKYLCYAEYTGFFRVGMVERGEHNAIIQHGTMCVVRRSALDEVGCWSEWCITEDTELGLRLLEAGYSGVYVPVTLGWGLMPDTYDSYKTQRYRWVYGAMQIMKRHGAEIFRGKSKLTWAQRYHFVAGWIPWVADGLALIFTFFALIWTSLMAIAPKSFDVPLTALSAVVLTLFVLKAVKTVWLYRAKVGSGFFGAIAAALTGLSLSYTVANGVISGIFTSSKPFLRTPKCEPSVSWIYTLRLAAVEAILLLATLASITVTVITSRLDDPAEQVWVAVLAVLAVPYASSLLVAIGSTIQFRRGPISQSSAQPVLQTSKMDIAA
ncbi:MAG: hypothetical protein CMG46_13830 [Candidatus Marinimicrobia bacterium]|nr:hypothetical protein [Candidatus Neomarinimicrobiota bacterium]